MNSRMKMQGFSLIELMIVVAIIAIIAAIAYPSYEKSVMRSDRSDAMSTLTQDAQVMERCYTQDFSYLANPPNCTTATLAGNTPKGFYTISIPTQTTATYVLQATANAGGREANDADCQKFTLDNTGAKASFAASGATTSGECWSD